ncbi:hypothetical protein AB4090_00210 [Acidithiobacillus sp. IBUN Pt1247-S3]
MSGQYYTPNSMAAQLATDVLGTVNGFVTLLKTALYYWLLA